MDVTKPYKFIGFGDIHGPKPYEFIGLRWAFISQTPVATDLTSTIGFFRFCAMAVVPAQVFAGRGPATTCAGPTGIAQNQENRCGTN